MLLHSDEAHKVALAKQGHDVEQINLIIYSSVGFLLRLELLLSGAVPAGLALATAQVLHDGV